MIEDQHIYYFREQEQNNRADQSNPNESTDYEYKFNGCDEMMDRGREQDKRFGIAHIQNQNGKQEKGNFMRKMEVVERGTRVWFSIPSSIFLCLQTKIK